MTEGRKETMQVIASMADLLGQMMPGHLGRYTDEFYPTATGDNFQKMGHNTVLIESGHSFADYKRIKTRRATFIALLEGLRFIASKDKSMDHELYFDIPNNEKQYLDIIIKDVLVDQRRTDIGILFIEELQDGKVQFRPSVDKLENLKDYNADKILDGESLEFKAKGDVMNWVKNKFN